MDQGNVRGAGRGHPSDHSRPTPPSMGPPVNPYGRGRGRPPYLQPATQGPRGGDLTPSPYHDQHVSSTTAPPNTGSSFSTITTTPVSSPPAHVPTIHQSASDATAHARLDGNFAGIIAPADAPKLSPEEIKLIRYNEGLRFNNTLSGGTILSEVRPSSTSQVLDAYRGAGIPNEFPELLKGPGVEVKVQRVGTTSDDTNTTDTYTIPEALLRRCSPYLAVKCDDISKQSGSKTITFVYEDTTWFSSFVTWMCCGRYIALDARDQVVEGRDAMAWVLGDKLQSVEFKDCIMHRLYTEYTSQGPIKTIYPWQIQYVCRSTEPDSKLRLFFLDILAAYFPDKSRVGGTWEQWDAVFQKYADARAFMLWSYMTMTADRLYIKPYARYMEQKPEEIVPVVAELGTNVQTEKLMSVVPVKRNADGTPVEKAITDVPTKVSDDAAIATASTEAEEGATGHPFSAVSITRV
ncbi:hypothetical protein CC86DRAFT_472458 [Ophiobolus disseminans]|uniref:Uncharacterized protein n=1 Tax=Ophiobolus disseminans TaxID=1469910 RepID=A0A6A6ZD66_9PLEO|nr:hypothetical protein CC86DRAFT_472458 [Ophiobolus disseminans]